MATLDSFLNAIIPPLVVIFIIFICAYPFREPLGKLWEKFKDWKEGRGQRENEMTYNKSINYE